MQIHHRERTTRCPCVASRDSSRAISLWWRLVSMSYSNVTFPYRSTCAVELWRAWIELRRSSLSVSWKPICLECVTQVMTLALRVIICRLSVLISHQMWAKQKALLVLFVEIAWVVSLCWPDDQVVLCAHLRLFHRFPCVASAFIENVNMFTACVNECSQILI